MRIGWKLFIILLVIIFGTLFIAPFLNVNPEQSSTFISDTILLFVFLIALFEGYEYMKKKENKETYFFNLELIHVLLGTKPLSLSIFFRTSSSSVMLILTFVMGLTMKYYK